MGVELLFEDPALAELCSSQHRLATRYGATAARSICARLHEVEAAASPSELERLPHLAVREVASSPATVSLVLVDGYRLVLRAIDRAVSFGSEEWATAASVIAVSLIEESAR
jgi:plasmid maintenance system killer protein